MIRPVQVRSVFELFDHATRKHIVTLAGPKPALPSTPYVDLYLQSNYTISTSETGVKSLGQLIGRVMSNNSSGGAPLMAAANSAGQYYSTKPEEIGEMLRAGYGFSGFCGWVFELQQPMTALLLRAVSTDKNNHYYYTLDFPQFETKEGDKVVDPNAPAAGGKVFIPTLLWLGIKPSIKRLLWTG